MLYARYDINIYEVSFDTDGGSDVSPAYIYYNDKVTKPEDPTKEGYTFNGWFIDSAKLIPYDFDDPVTSDLTLYAKFDITKYKVSFIVDGLLIVSVNVAYNYKLTKPNDPTKDYHMFTGWYLDKETTLLFDFETLVTTDITLYAGWDTFKVAEVDYNAVLNEGLGTYYIKVTAPLVDLLPTDIKGIYRYMEAGKYVEQEELEVIAGDPYLWFGVAKLDANLNYKAEGIYAYKIVLLDDSEFVFYFNYDQEQVLGLPEVLGSFTNYVAVYNEARSTYYISVAVSDSELLDSNTIKAIRIVRQANYIITPISLTPDTDTVLWFSVAGSDGVIMANKAGLYAFEVTRLDDSKYVFTFFFNPDDVTGIANE